MVYSDALIAEIVGTQDFPTGDTLSGVPAPTIENKTFPTSLYVSDPSLKVKGVAILLHKNCQFQTEAVHTDPEGRYVFLKGMWKGQPVTIANVYCPNVKQLTFIENMLSQLHTFAHRMIILGGDLNVALNPALDV